MPCLVFLELLANNKHVLFFSINLLFDDMGNTSTMPIAPNFYVICWNFRQLPTFANNYCRNSWFWSCPKIQTKAKINITLLSLQIRPIRANSKANLCF